MFSREPSDLEEAEQKGAGRTTGGQAAQSVREPRGHLRGRGRQAARRSQVDQKDAEFRVARKAQSSLGCADQS